MGGTGAGLSWPGPGTVVTARATGVLGELVLRRRRPHPPAVGADDVVELVSNGVFLMDTEDGSTERRLATDVLARLPDPTGPDGGLSVLVGGLGLGATTQAVLADPRVRRVVVVEIEPALVDWVRRGLVPPAAGLLDDPRVEVVVADVAQVLREGTGAPLDAVLLDVDNGPLFLTHPLNEDLYSPAGLAGARDVLVPGGVLAVWSADVAPDLHRALEQVVGPCERVDLTVTRAGRDLGYVLYLARRA